jgi:hypothetical protein
LGELLVPRWPAALVRPRPGRGFGRWRTAKAMRRRRNFLLLIPQARHSLFTFLPKQKAPLQFRWRGVFNFWAGLAQMST